VKERGACQPTEGCGEQRREEQQDYGDVDQTALHGCTNYRYEMSGAYVPWLGRVGKLGRNMLRPYKGESSPGKIRGK
jgi:hypothetical protein